MFPLLWDNDEWGQTNVIPRWARGAMGARRQPGRNTKSLFFQSEFVDSAHGEYCILYFHMLVSHPSQAWRRQWGLRSKFMIDNDDEDTLVWDHLLAPFQLVPPIQCRIHTVYFGLPKPQYLIENRSTWWTPLERHPTHILTVYKVGN